MRYKVGDKIKIVRATFGCCGAEGKIGVITNKHATYGLADLKDGFNVDCDDGHVWRISFESECELLDELTAEEATKILSEICCENELCGGCPISEAKGKMTCQSFRRDKTEEVLEILKQWKKDHEKKEVETEFTWCVLIIEADTHTLKHEEEVGTDFKSIDAKKAEILKKYCSEHDGKYYAISERRCVVKE